MLDKEYNELCDRCDVLDAKHFVLLSQQDATEQTLSHMNQNVELARDGLETLTGQIEERERCSIVQHKCTLHDIMQSCESHQTQFVLKRDALQ